MRRFNMKQLRLFILILFISTLVSCGAYQYATAEKGSDGATKEQQADVKTQVMKLLEEEYNQPFKLESFDYEYERHWVDNTCQMSFCKMKKYGTYYFKIKAIDNPIIIIDFNMNDGLATKESIKPLIDSFKKNQLNDLFCIGLTRYYSRLTKNLNMKPQQPYTESAEKYCNSINQNGYKIYKDYYTKNKK